MEKLRSKLMGRLIREGDYEMACYREQVEAWKRDNEPAWLRDLVKWSQEELRRNKKRHADNKQNAPCS